MPHLERPAPNLVREEGVGKPGAEQRQDFVDFIFADMASILSY